MSLFESCDTLGGIFINKRNVLELAKIYLMVDDRLTSPIPSNVIEADAMEIIDYLGISEYAPDGIAVSDMPYLATVLYWSIEKKAFSFYKNIIPFILDIDPCRYVSVAELYKLPKHGIYCEIPFKNFYGFVVGWDYRMNYAGEQVDILNFCWLSHDGEGSSFQIELPKKYELLNLDTLSQTPFFNLLEKAIGVTLYVLMQENTPESVVVNGNVYGMYGKELSAKIESKKDNENVFGRVGHWRKGHIHLYWKILNGAKVAIHKWIEPTWVSGSVVKRNAKK